MLVQFVIEQLESELQILYSKLDKTSDIHDKERIQKAIQDRNIRLVRLMPNE